MVDMRLMLLAVAALPLAGCTVTDAEMIQPLGLAGVMAVPISGVSGGRSGSFAIGTVSGQFTRSAERVGFADSLIESRKGWTKFDVSGAPFAAPVSAECRMRERTLNFGWVTETLRPMSFLCEFADSATGKVDELEVQAERPTRAEFPIRRAGELRYRGATIRVRSEHRIAGTNVEMPAPFGYRFEADGKALGSVDIDGPAELRLHPRVTDDERRAITLAAVALDLFWDPAEE